MSSCLQNGCWSLVAPAVFPSLGARRYYGIIVSTSLWQYDRYFIWGWFVVKYEWVKKFSQWSLYVRETCSIYWIRKLQFWLIRWKSFKEKKTFFSVWFGHQAALWSRRKNSRQRESLRRSSVANKSCGRILRWLMLVVVVVCSFSCLLIPCKELLTSEGHFLCSMYHDF